MGTIDQSTEPSYTDNMVSYALIAVALLPLALGGMVMDKDMMQRMYAMQNMHNMQHMQGMQGMQGMVQMNGMMQVMPNQMMHQNNYNMHGMESEESKESSESEDSSEEEGHGNAMAGQWWGMTNKEDMEAYMKWCEERKMQMKEQEEAQKLLRQITHEAEEKKREHSREKMMKEAKMRRDNMVAQWRMWQNQIKQTEAYDDQMAKYTDMKIKYMFSLTMDYLKFCKCSDDTSALQRYLRHGDMTYEPGMSQAYDLSDLEGVDLNDEEAVAQRMATLPDADQVKLYFTGMILTTCDAVKTYVNQLKQWEQQYNFMGM